MWCSTENLQKTLSVGREFTFLYIHSLNVSLNKIGFTFSWCMVWVNDIIKILPSNDDDGVYYVTNGYAYIMTNAMSCTNVNLLLPSKTFFSEIRFSPIPFRHKINMSFGKMHYMKKVANCCLATNVIFGLDKLLGYFLSQINEPWSSDNSKLILIIHIMNIKILRTFFRSNATIEVD